MIRPPFPHVLDSSMMGSFRSCPQRFRMEYLEHWKPKQQSVHLIAGAAYAKGIEVARESYYLHERSPQEALGEGIAALLKAYGDFQWPEDSAKSPIRMAGALEFYFNQYPLESETATPIKISAEKCGVEFSFAEPIDATNPETGDPILYVGRMDMICDFAGGVYGEDDKTTSSLGASWSKQWDLRSQFTGYTWGAGKAGFALDGFLIRGVSILKTKYDTQQAITYRPQWMIDRWYGQLIRDVERMERMWESGYFDYNLDNACNEYGGCVFRQVCMSKEPSNWLEGSFERRRWDPVNRTEELVS